MFLLSSDCMALQMSLDMYTLLEDECRILPLPSLFLEQ